MVPTEHRGASRFGRRETCETFVATSPGETEENSTADESVFAAALVAVARPRVLRGDVRMARSRPRSNRAEGVRRGIQRGTKRAPRPGRGPAERRARGAPRVRSRRGIARGGSRPPAAVDADRDGLRRGVRAPGAGGRRERPRGRDGEPAGRRGEVIALRSRAPGEKRKKKTKKASSFHSSARRTAARHRSIAGARRPRYRAMRGRRRADALHDHFRQQNARFSRAPARAGSGGRRPSRACFFSVTRANPSHSRPASTSPASACASARLSHTTYSRPLRFTILHASHRRLIAERDLRRWRCGAGSRGRVARDRGGGMATRLRGA